MPRQFYCSACGAELNHQRKAVPGKGIILDTIEPHECEGYVAKEAPEGEQTLIQYLESLPKIKPTDAPVDKSNPDNQTPGTFPTINDGDRRDSSDKKTTAPEGVLQNFNNLLGD